MIVADEFLVELFDQLGYTDGGDLYLLDDEYPAHRLALQTWVEQARELGAEAIYFVKDNPVVLFFSLGKSLAFDVTTLEESLRDLHQRVWNSSRIPMFFVSLPTEIRVYSAYQKPAPDIKAWSAEERWLQRVQKFNQIGIVLHEFSRAEVDSGRLFTKYSQAFDRANRVDQLLLSNLRLLLDKLARSDKKRRQHAHALIGRSIFVRYLEDRGVLTDEYFAELPSSGKYRRYTDVLQSKKDTYRFFRRLRVDFNGDLFPLSKAEEDAITDDDLAELRRFLRGETLHEQQELFFWAYRFDIIPTELISSIYEEFYREYSQGDDNNTHYTPMSLVDFVLTESLTPERLADGARVLDPACGSGVFLVEAFKRIVYFEKEAQKLATLPRELLEEILTTRIVGYDINPSAIQIAAFSLYLAFLDFMRPRDIRQHKQLPRLVHTSAEKESGSTLYNINFFAFTESEVEQAFPRGATAILERLPILPGVQNGFDVIVGNPPWGAAPRGDLVEAWCEALKYVIGDREYSQAFILRASRLLRHGGEVGLLVSSGVLFKHHDNSRDFRFRWLRENRIRAVYNFAHTRRYFFQSAVSPFVGVFYSPARGLELADNKVTYVTIKRSILAERIQAVLIEQPDVRRVHQVDLLAHEWMWKTYMWGGLLDVELIGELKDTNITLHQVVGNSFGQGYKESGFPKDKEAKGLGVSRELTTADIDKPQPLSKLTKPVVPRKLHRLGVTEMYSGPRLLVKRGVSRSLSRYGEIRARLAYDPFAFRNSIIAFGLENVARPQRKILCGIFLSSLVKYYHFMTCSTWGVWRDEIHVGEHLSLPVRLKGNTAAEARIARVVDVLFPADADPQNAFTLTSPDYRLSAIDELDEAVFDLYELSDYQRDLVRDACAVTLELFYEGTEAKALKSPSPLQLKEYAGVFISVWNDRLEPHALELQFHTYTAADGLLCGCLFELVPRGAGQNVQGTAPGKWSSKLSQYLRYEYSASILVDRVVKEIADDHILIIKRANMRLWTKSQGRQDANEMLTLAFRHEWTQKNEVAK